MIRYLKDTPSIGQTVEFIAALPKVMVEFLEKSPGAQLVMGQQASFSESVHLPAVASRDLIADKDGFVGFAATLFESLVGIDEPNRMVGLELVEQFLLEFAGGREVVENQIRDVLKGSGFRRDRGDGGEPEIVAKALFQLVAR